MTIIDLDMEKARRIEKAVEMTPAQLIKIIADDFDRGDFVDSFGMIAVVFSENANGDHVLESYRCGLDAAQEIGYMEMWKRDRLKKWEK